ncbi:MAG: DUF1614 domain-containing protein [Acetobacteraceae bacterium]|nr:DUF1614 domain-containing protein [Acetobacteraceae bacterium]
MPVGSIVLAAAAVLIYLGVGHRVLDRMRLNDRVALGFLLAILLGGFIDLPLFVRPVEVRLNVGGGIMPIVLAVYLVGTADTAEEKRRAVAAAVLVGAAAFALGKLLPAAPEQRPIMEPFYAYALVAGVVGYLSGRSRRASFVAGTMGVVLAEAGHLVELAVRGVSGRAWIGGAGAFDSVVVAGFLAVLLAEVVGEAREKVASGRAGRGGPPGGGEAGAGGEPGAGGGGRP